MLGEAVKVVKHELRGGWVEVGGRLGGEGTQSLHVSECSPPHTHLDVPAHAHVEGRHVKIDDLVPGLVVGHFLAVRLVPVEHARTPVVLQPMDEGKLGRSKMAQKSKRPAAAPTVLVVASDGLREPSRTGLRDADLYTCIDESPTLSEASKCTYRGGLRSLLTRAPSPGGTDPLLRAITDYDGTERAILTADVALRTRQAWRAAVLACFKHACSSAPELQAVHGRWSALNARLSDEISAIVKASIMSDKERAAWVPYIEWCAAEERLAREEFGSQRHLLVALSCRVPPARGGDYGLVHIVAPDSPLAADTHSNVLLWGQASQPSMMLIKQHKTSRLKGTLTKPLPPSVRAIIEASLKALPRPTLFVSELTRQPFNSEASFQTWACRAFHGVFGKHVTMNGARHAFLSAIDTSRMSTSALEALAREMGHSLGQQRAYFKLSERAEAIRTADGELRLPLLNAKL